MFKHIDAETVAKWLSENEITIIDVRDFQSFQTGHISTALYVDNNNVQQFISNADLNKPLIVCCYHGNSSQGAAQYFFEQGFKDSYSLDGGFEQWRISQPNKISI